MSNCCFISNTHLLCSFYFIFHIKVYAVVVSHEPSGDLSPAAVSYTSGFYQIPVIGISSRDAAFSDKNIHVSFLRTVPPYYHQADVWLEMLNHFGYTKVRIRWWVLGCCTWYRKKICIKN